MTDTTETLTTFIYNLHLTGKYTHQIQAALVKKFPNLRMFTASEITNTSISSCLSGRYKTAGGYLWS